MKRNKHNLSHYNLVTCDMGELIPLSATEVLPGDSVQAHTSLLLRVSPLVAPVMHPVQVRVHHWFVPYRLLWDGWEDFITGGPDGLGSADAFPTFTTDATTGIGSGTPLDYLGVPPGVPDLEVSALPLKAYHMIWDEFYRDQDLCPKTNYNEGGDIQTGNYLQRCAWEKDYFAAARPWPQKGPEVTMPLGLAAPVKGIGKFNQTFDLTNQSQYETGATGVGTFAKATNMRGDNPQQDYFVEEDANNPGFPGIYADLANATAVNINDVRKAFALQRYQEARARYGSRYTEYLRYLGVRSSDARLQRPEYLGGGKSTISFSEVLKTGAGEDPAEPIGTMKGHGISAMRSRRFRRFFEEHGVVISLLSVRPRTMYTQGLHRSWLRRTKEDFWQKELEHIGQQEILTQEVYAAAGAGEIFGYADRYAEYRSCPNRISGEFRDIMDYWHMGREFAATPVLNQSFVQCEPTKRIHAIQTNDVLWVMAQNHIVARRLVSSNAAPRLY